MLESQHILDATRPLSRPALRLAGARGFGLHQLLAGRRLDGRHALPLSPVEVCKATGWIQGGPYPATCLFPSTLTRALRGLQISEQNLRRIAAGLGIEVEEVRRAYTVTLVQIERRKKKAGR